MYFEVILLLEHCESLLNYVTLGLRCDQPVVVWEYVIDPKVVREMMLPKFSREGLRIDQGIDVSPLNGVTVEQLSQRCLIVFCKSEIQGRI